MAGTHTFNQARVKFSLVLPETIYELIEENAIDWIDSDKTFFQNAPTI